MSVSKPASKGVTDGRMTDAATGRGGAKRALAQGGAGPSQASEARA
ncbi:hypothetical protein N9D63_02995 [Opitutales bacterium]|nr:hypothetical protein [Opitutales bacterium]